MGDTIRRLILSEFPDYDFERYRYVAGDLVTTLDGALILVKESALDYVTAYVIKRSLSCREKGVCRVYYDNLPDLRKGEYVRPEYKVVNKLKWSVGDIVSDGVVTAYLFEEVHPQEFHAFVVESENSYYLHTGIYLPNPYKHYFACS